MSERSNSELKTFNGHQTSATSDRLQSQNGSSPSPKLRKHQQQEQKQQEQKQKSENHLHDKSSRNGHLPISKKEGNRFTSFLHHTVMPLFLMILTPNLVTLVWYTAARCDGSVLNLASRFAERGFTNALYQIWSDVHIGSSLITWCLLGYLAWALLLAVVVPGPTALGPVTPKGHVPVYKDNGFRCYLATMAAFVLLTLVLKQFGLSPTIIYDRFDELIVTLTLFTHLLCIFLYFKGLTFPSTDDSGTSGNPLFDYYWGTELYPRVCGVDIKVFTNCRFGLTVWPLLVLIFALKSYELHGFVDSMLVSAALQMVYLTKFFWWEAGYMNTIDIMLDRAGYYICWGCMVYVTGIYTSVSMYLVNHPVQLGAFWSSTIFLIGAVSIYINYWADRQKMDVRLSSGKCLIWGKKAEVIRAKYRIEGAGGGGSLERESLLLVSGWWGVSRHFHYLPELVAAFCWTVPALFENVLVYLYCFHLVGLLGHRVFRDEDKCRRKYGTYWEEYRRKVPARVIPGIF